MISAAKHRQTRRNAAEREVEDLTPCKPLGSILFAEFFPYLVGFANMHAEKEINNK